MAVSGEKEQLGEDERKPARLGQKKYKKERWQIGPPPFVVPQKSSFSLQQHRKERSRVPRHSRQPDISNVIGSDLGDCEKVKERHL